MQNTPQVSPREFVESLREESESFLASVMEAVNQAADGEWIVGSEERVRDLSAEFRQQVFQAAVQERIDAAEAAFSPPQETVTDPVTQQPQTKRLRNKGRQPTHVLTINGRVQLWRRWWHSPQSGSVAPADACIDQPGRTLTPGVREMAGRLNNDSSSFDRAAENLARTAQVKMSGEQLRRVVLAEGRAVLAAQEADAIPTAFDAQDCPADPAESESPTRLYNGVDGVMVPVIGEHEKTVRRETVEQKRVANGRPLDTLPPRRPGCDEAYKEFKAIVFYDESGTHWHESLRYCRRPQVGGIVRREALRLNFAAADERVANVDGADWIREQLQELDADQLPLDGLGLDFYHLSENVHRCRREVFGADDEPGRSWAEQLLHTFKHEGYAAAWEQLLQWRLTLRGQAKKATADWLIHYVQERQEMICYPDFRARGWQIGSGPTESRCKTTTSRLKGRGRRWDPVNAEAVAALTTLRDSDQWYGYWPTTPTTSI